MMQQQNKPTGNFNNLGIDQKILSILAKKRFEVPTPIQRQIIPGALQGKDAVGIAQTGTGKTLAFSIPMIQQILQNQNKAQGLILLPTRELALQVEKAVMNIGAPLGIRTALIIGGVPQNAQVQSLKRRPHIVIATPGRLDDLIKQGAYRLNQVKIITLDEADRMLDIGFLPQIKRIMQTAPKDRQTMLFSATMPKSISQLASAFMKMPLRIEIAPQGTSAENVEQEVFVVTKNNKMRLLDSVLQQYESRKVLIFSRTKHGAKRIARDVRNMGHKSTEIHSNRSQPQRKAAMEGFTRGKFTVMVATDIAARGIDVRDISLVVNFDLPNNSEDYVHRIGRTGRAGKTGKAISFVTPSEKADIKKIERLIRKSLPILSLPSLPDARPKPARFENQHSFSHGQKNSNNRNKRRNSSHRGQGGQSKNRGQGGRSNNHGEKKYSYKKNKKRSSRNRRHNSSNKGRPFK